MGNWSILSGSGVNLMSDFLARHAAPISDLVNSHFVVKFILGSTFNAVSVFKIIFVCFVLFSVFTFILSLLFRIFGFFITRLLRIGR